MSGRLEGDIQCQVAQAELRDARAALVLRLGGTATLMATLAVFLPTSWMAQIHTFAGLGPFPDSMIMQYLARSASAIYALNGALLWLLSFHVVRYRHLISWIGFGIAVLGVVKLCIDFYVAMPLIWTLIEGPPVILIGVLLWHYTKDQGPS